MDRLKCSLPTCPPGSTTTSDFEPRFHTERRGALQKHLAAEGTSFQALKDALRRDLAIVRLHTSTAPLASLADELGFADSATFQRAFKNWTGSAPGAYRRGGAGLPEA